MRLLAFVLIAGVIIAGVIVLLVIARPDDPERPSHLDGLGGYDDRRDDQCDAQCDHDGDAR